MDFDSRRGYELRVLSGAFEHRRILRADQTAGEIIAVWGVTGPVRLAARYEYSNTDICLLAKVRKHRLQ